MLSRMFAIALLGGVLGCVPVEQGGGGNDPMLGAATEESQPSPVTARLIGSTLAEGALQPDGKWLQMAVIDRPVPGWITDQETGMSTQVELRPLQGDGIDQISLGALMALGIDEARLVIVDVYYDVSAVRAAN